MGKRFIKNIPAFFISYLFIPILFTEIFSQLYHETGYVYEVYKKFKNNKDLKDENTIFKFLHNPNKIYKESFQTLYGDPYQIKKVSFKTDKYGTIVPSTIESNINKLKKSYFFCGGSTTESFAIPEGKRVTDVYSRQSGNPAINASRSGQDLRECVSTIESFIKNFETPRLFILAININTLMNFGFKFENTLNYKEYKNDSNKTSLAINKLKNFFNTILPGNYQNLSKSKATIKRKFILKNPTKINYERSLIAGCCYGPSKFNNPLSNQKIKFEWDNKNLQKKYSDYLAIYLGELKAILKKYSLTNNNFVFFIEPNSFSLKNEKKNFDYRQYLFDDLGTKLDGLVSGKKIAIYDSIFKNSLSNFGFQFIEVDYEKLIPNYFYDAAHYTVEGSIFIGNLYAKELEKLYK